MKVRMQKIDLPDSDISYCEDFIATDQANDLFKLFRKTIPWRQDKISLFGKSHLQPRLTAFYANNNKAYTYSNLKMEPLEFTPELLQLKEQLEIYSPVQFTSCLLNLYRDGKDSNGWHADDEASLGINPVIASISLGEERSFHLKHKTNKALKHKIQLAHGSLLLMKGPTQHCWFHQLPKTSKIIGERINLTFRLIP